MIHDETSPALSPSKKRQPMTYFLYPGLDSADLTKFLSKNKASHACMRKALHDLNVNASCTLLPASNDVTPDDIDDEVFLTNNDYEVVTEKITSLQLEEYCPDDRDIMDDLDPRTTDLDSSMDRSRCDGHNSQASSQLTLQNCEMMSLTEEKHCERSSLTSVLRRRKKVHFKKIQRFFKRIRYFFKSRRVHSHARSCDILQVCNKCGKIADVKVHTC
ncbi:uncharacterized protein LOC124120663 [Haliotis rufescens]|uniref:uncharacterized protein LOC124120663 n=1 Tax=Haliotis rufescens TaxID=6454 RepID=UPI00201F1D82|nr:uncharacterized protein LOC124120663 [Haliotis rufescens]